MNRHAVQINHGSVRSTFSIPFINLSIQNQAIVSEWFDLAGDLIQNNSLIKGKEVDQFEKEFATFNNVRHCIGVASGTDALFLALKACGIGRNHEVITVSHSFIATAEAIAMTGARPVFVDINDKYFTMDSHRIESAITGKTRAIIPVHLYGQCVDMDPILQIAHKHNLYIIEDACQAHGAMYKRKRAGSIGHLGCFSFYPTKNLGALGDGGAVITSDPDLNQRVRQMADHGQSSRYHHIEKGTNSRLDSLQAAALRIKLRHLDSWNQQRNQIAEKYDNLLFDVVRTPSTNIANTHVYHLYVIQTKYRDTLQNFLKEKGIETMIHYPIPIHKQPAFRFELNRKDNNQLNSTESVTNRILSLPLYPGMNQQEIVYISDAILKFFREKNCRD